MYVEDEILYIYLNHQLVKVYKNISSENENVANFAFSDLIPNADRAEIENCKVVDFCIGTQNFTYDMYSSLYNAKNYWAYNSRVTRKVVRTNQQIKACWFVLTT